jgi:hypothetical protein
MVRLILGGVMNGWKTKLVQAWVDEAMNVSTHSLDILTRSARVMRFSSRQSVGGLDRGSSSFWPALSLRSVRAASSVSFLPVRTRRQAAVSGDR